MNYLAHNLSLHSNTSLKDAYQMTASDAKSFFEGKAFQDWQKSEENKLKLVASIGNRINGVISACDVIVKAVGNLAKSFR